MSQIRAIKNSYGINENDFPKLPNQLLKQYIPINKEYGI